MEYIQNIPGQAESGSRAAHSAYCPSMYHPVCDKHWLISSQEHKEFIHYSNNVILVCTKSGYKSPVLTVRKVGLMVMPHILILAKIEKAGAAKTADDPLSQLQKVPALALVPPC